MKIQTIKDVCLIPFYIALMLFGTAIQAEEVAPKKYNLSICAIFKDEASHLKEWIEYHRLIGVDHFYLYNNGSRDRFYFALSKYIDDGVVTLIDWPDFMSPETEEKWSFSTQIPAYENAARVVAGPNTKWLAFINVDEFLIPTHTLSLTEVLQKYDSYPGITLESDCFDASKEAVFPRRRLLIETVELTSAPLPIIYKSVEKTIFQPEQLDHFTWPPYRCIFKENATAVLLDRDEMRLNHYANRFKGYLYFGAWKDKLDVDNRILSDAEVKHLLQVGYEIEDKERVIFRYIPEMLKRLKK